MDKIKQWLHTHFQLKNISWLKVVIVLGALAISWWALQGVVPEPWHDRLQGAITFLAVFIATLLKAAKAGEPILPPNP